MNEEIKIVDIKEKFNKRLEYRSDYLYESHLNRILLGVGLVVPTGPFGVIFLTGSIIFLTFDSSITATKIIYYKLMKNIRKNYKPV